MSRFQRSLSAGKLLPPLQVPGGHDDALGQAEPSRDGEDGPAGAVPAPSDHHLHLAAPIRPSPSVAQGVRLSPVRKLEPLRLLADYGCDCCAGADAGDAQAAPAAAEAGAAEAALPRTTAQARRDYAAEAIRSAKERRDREAEKSKRRKAKKDMWFYKARQKVLETFEDGELKEYATSRLALEEPQLDLLEPLGQTPRKKRMTISPSGNLHGSPETNPHGTDQKIDFHQHCMFGDEEGLQALLAASAAWGIEKCVLLSLRLIKSTRSDVGRRNDWVLAMAEKHPAVIPFVTVIEDDPMAGKMFESCLDRGAKGLKLIGWHSEYIRKYDYDLCNPALLDCFRLAARRGAPVLLHIWVGYSKTKRDYHQALDTIMTQHPDLRLVLAHFGLGFDPENLPGIVALLERHRNLYVDTSLYGSNCELWFTRASNQAGPLGSFVRRFPKQVLFGTDVFGSRLKQPKELSEAMSASISFLTQDTLVCEEFKCTDYIARTREDKYGLVAFDPLRLRGLRLGAERELLRRVFFQNAMDALQLA